MVWRFAGASAVLLTLWACPARQTGLMKDAAGANGAGRGRTFDSMPDATPCGFCLCGVVFLGFARPLIPNCESIFRTAGRSVRGVSESDPIVIMNFDAWIRN